MLFGKSIGRPSLLSSQIATMEFDPIETCPYDKIHRIRRSRMQFHIMVCSKNFPNSEKMQCPFDARHKVDQVDFDDHVNHCLARESIIDYDSTLQVEENILPIDVNPVIVTDTERWGECVDFQTYSPLQAIQDKPIVYPIIGLSKAKRKKHRMQERMRYNQIMENGGNQFINETSNSLLVDNEENEQEEKPLRRPYRIGKKINCAPQNKNQNLTPPKIVKPQLPPKMSVDNKDDKEEYAPLRRPHNIGNKNNSAPQNKNQNLIPSKESKKLLPIVKKIFNVPFSYETEQNENNLGLNNSKDNDSVIDKLSRTFEEIAVKDEKYKKKTKQLDKEMNNWIKVSSKKRAKHIRKQNC